MKDQSNNFEKFIENLIDQNIDIETLEESVWEIYKDGWRHSYSFVTRFLLRKKSTAKELSETLESLSSRIDDLIPLFSDEKADFDLYDKNKDQQAVHKKEYQRCHRALEKLKDHVDLETIRMTHLYKQALDPVKKQYSEIHRKLNKAEDRIDHQRTESITILGIFASIIITFVAGFSLSNALLSNIKSLSFGTVGFWCVVLMGFIVNVLYSLYNMLYTLNGKPKILWWKNWFNVILLGLAIVFITIAVYKGEI